MTEGEEGEGRRPQPQEILLRRSPLGAHPPAAPSYLAGPGLPAAPAPPPAPEEEVAATPGGPGAGGAEAPPAPRPGRSAILPPASPGSSSPGPGRASPVSWAAATSAAAALGPAPASVWAAPASGSPAEGRRGRGQGGPSRSPETGQGWLPDLGRIIRQLLGGESGVVGGRGTRGSACVCVVWKERESRSNLNFETNKMCGRIVATVSHESSSPTAHSVSLSGASGLLSFSPATGRLTGRPFLINLSVSTLLIGSTTQILLHY